MGLDSLVKSIAKDEISPLVKQMGLPSITLEKKAIMELDYETNGNYVLLVDVNNVTGLISKIGALARDVAAAAQRLDSQNKLDYSWVSGERPEKHQGKVVSMPYAAVNFQGNEIATIQPRGGMKYQSSAYYRNAFRVVPHTVEIAGIDSRTFLNVLSKTYQSKVSAEIRQYLTPVLQ